MANLFTDLKRQASYTHARNLLSTENITKRKSLREDLTSVFLQHAFQSSSEIFFSAAVRAPVFVKTGTEETC